MQIDVGHRIADRYEVIKRIGQGGMADVHLATDMRLSRRVAIKTLRTDPQCEFSEVSLKRFRREAEAVASLNHPNIVAIYDTGEESFPTLKGEATAPYVVMEYVEGRTVKDLLADGRPVPVEEVVKIIVGVLSALEHSHTKGVVHRDIKPNNVMITAERAIKVLDFGIARAMSDSQTKLTRANSAIGTAFYMSPEQARGDDSIDGRTDIYSAGCLFFELLAGRPPFIDESEVTVICKHIAEDAPVLSSIAPHIPDNFDHIIVKALEKKPHFRYATAAQMREDVLDAAGKLKESQQKFTTTAPTTPMKPVRGTSIFDTPKPSGRSTADNSPPRIAKDNTHSLFTRVRSHMGFFFLPIILTLGLVFAVVFAYGVISQPDISAQIADIKPGTCLTTTPVDLQDDLPSDWASGTTPCDSPDALAKIIAVQTDTEPTKECVYDDGCMSFNYDDTVFLFNAIPHVGQCYYGYRNTSWLDKGSEESPLFYRITDLAQCGLSSPEWIDTNQAVKLLGVDRSLLEPFQSKIESLQDSTTACPPGQHLAKGVFSKGTKTFLCVSRTDTARQTPTHIGPDTCLTIAPANLMYSLPPDWASHTTSCDSSDALVRIIAAQDATQSTDNCSLKHDGCMWFRDGDTVFRFNAIPRVGLCYYDYQNLKQPDEKNKQSEDGDSYIAQCGLPIAKWIIKSDYALRLDVDESALEPVQYEIEGIETDASACLPGQTFRFITFSKDETKGLCFSKTSITTASSGAAPTEQIGLQNMSVGDCVEVMYGLSTDSSVTQIAPPEKVSCDSNTAAYKVLSEGSTVEKCRADLGDNFGRYYTSSGHCIQRWRYEVGDCSPAKTDGTIIWGAVISCDVKPTDKYPHIMKIDSIISSDANCPKDTLKFDSSGGKEKFCISQVQ